MIWLNDSVFHKNWSVISFFVNHHFKFHFGIAKHIVYEIGVVRTQLLMLFEKVF